MNKAIKIVTIGEGDPHHSSEPLINSDEVIELHNHTMEMVDLYLPTKQELKQSKMDRINFRRTN